MGSRKRDAPSQSNVHAIFSLSGGLATPAALAPVEIAGIMQARQLRCCYFNEFREYLNLVPLASFEDFSEKVEVQTALKELYGTPDKVELFAGVLVERSKVIGLRLPYTISRAILSDAVNLLRDGKNSEGWYFPDWRFTFWSSPLSY